MALVWKTFLRYEAEEYEQEGIENFLHFISDERLRKLFLIGEYLIYGAFCGQELVGMVSMRNECHISLLFVSSAFHKKGIGRLLIGALEETVASQGRKDYLTVNAAPYAVGFYHRVGFEDLGAERKQDGIIYTPMKKSIPACSRQDG